MAAYLYSILLVAPFNDTQNLFYRFAVWWMRILILNTTTWNILLFYSFCVVVLLECLFVIQEIAQGKKRIVSSSSGNSGLCCAYVGQKLGVPVKVIVPGCTSQYMVDRITEEVHVLYVTQIYIHFCSDLLSLTTKSGGNIGMVSICPSIHLGFQSLSGK